MTPAALAQTHAAAFTDTRPWSEDEFASLLVQTGMILCGDAKSFVLGRVIGDEAEVLTLATHPDLTRQGLAQMRLDAFLSAARLRGALWVFLEVAEDNVAAKSLYFKYKFQASGYRPAYYQRGDGAKVGADVLRRSL